MKQKVLKMHWDSIRQDIAPDLDKPKEIVKVKSKSATNNTQSSFNVSAMNFKDMGDQLKAMKRASQESKGRGKSADKKRRMVDISPEDKARLIRIEKDKERKKYRRDKKPRRSRKAEDIEGSVRSDAASVGSHNSQMVAG